ncbi:helix-turn-helix domain-containing protein [Nocardia sp. NPDC058176]|uniref:helix-turn-helix domain-containing protein n=1 Tax=Nocardia sp. NPDC058176 TaxID=3346368 RepID=UPI0036DA8C3B
MAHSPYLLVQLDLQSRSPRQVHLVTRLNWVSQIFERRVGRGDRGRTARSAVQAARPASTVSILLPCNTLRRPPGHSVMGLGPASLCAKPCPKGKTSSYSGCEPVYIPRSMTVSSTLGTGRATDPEKLRSPMPSHEPRSAAPRSNRRTNPQQPSPPDDETWLSTAELAARLKIPAKTLATWASSGTGPRYARIGRYRRYRLGDIRAWEAERLDDSCGG